jgi:hypothetical protein
MIAHKPYSMTSLEQPESTEAPKQMTRQIICLTGPKGCGKSTVARHLDEEYNFARMAFAEPIKRGCQEMFGLSYDQVYSEKLKESVDRFWNATPRQILQTVGTELMRDALPKLLPGMKDVWVRQMVRRIHRSPKTARIVIEDLRFPDEYKAMKELGARVFRIVGRGETGDTHASENALADIPADVTLDNSGDIAKLLEQVNAQVQLPEPSGSFDAQVMR